MKPTLFLTGATGMVGRDLVRYLHAHTDANLVLLCRPGPAVGPGLPPGLPGSARLRVVPGDITRPDLGLAPDVRAALTASITHVVHAAACTRFDQTLEAARRVNVEGTRHVARFAASCPRLRQFGFVSTVYVAGRRTGLIREDELAHEAGFVNAYEQSKYEAEHVMRGFAASMPVAVYRLSTVFGDSRTGAVHTLTAPHHALRLLYLGLGAMLPGRADYPVDLVPSDFAAATLGRLFIDAFEPGLTVHIAAGATRACPLEAFIDLVYEAFAAHDPEWGRRGYPRPVLGSERAFDRFVATIDAAGNPFLRGMLRSVESFAGQLTCPKHFDLRNTVARMPSYLDALPPVQAYAARVVRQCAAAFRSPAPASRRPIHHAA